MYRTILRLLTAAALASAATVPPTAAPAVDAPEGAAGMTTLTLLVHGCDGCSITPVQAGDGSAPALWQGRTKKVRHGAVRWKVATRHTLGMSFNIVDFDGVALDSMTNIVVAYRGLKVGARVPNGVAAHKKRANGCWAGTRKASVTLRVRVEQFPGTSDLPPAVEGYRIRPYLTRTAPHLPIYKSRVNGPTFHGTIGNQDAYFCGPSSG